jgi:hypothetical protein
LLFGGDLCENAYLQGLIGTKKPSCGITVGKRSQHDDSYIRKAAIKYKIPYITTATAAAATAKGIAARQGKEDVVKSLQDYHADLGVANA